MMSRTPALDRRLLALSEARWLKVARIIGQAMEEMPSTGFPTMRSVFVAERIRALVRSRRLLGRGRLFRKRHAGAWTIRYSEVRLPVARRGLVWRGHWRGGGRAGRLI